MRHFLRSAFWLLSMLGLLAGPVAQGQTATWQASRSLNAATNANITASATDAAGMVYLAGWVQGTATFGRLFFYGDSFVAKWNPTTHSFMWVVGGGGPGTNIGSLAVDGTDVYVGGYFMGLSATFGPTTLISPPVPINTSYLPKGFVAKLTTTATGASYAWAWGTSTSDYKDYSYVYGLAAQGGSVYVAGMVTGTVQLGATTVSGGVDSYGYKLRVGYVVKLTGPAVTPAVTWSVLLNSSGTATEISSVAVAGAAVYVVGITGGTASLGSTPAGLSSTGGQVLAKLTDAGTAASVVWVVQPSASKTMSIGQLAVQGTSLYLAGTCTGATLTLGTITQANSLWAVAVGPPASQVYVAKLTDLNTGPAYRWLVVAGGEGFDSPTALVANGSALYVAGRFDSSHFTVGSTVLTNCHLTGMYGMIGPRNHEWFVARVLDGGSTASFARAQRAGSQLADEVNTMAVSGSEIYIAGETFEPASFTPSLPAGAAGFGTYAWLQESSVLATTSPVTSLASAVVFPNPAHGTATVHLPAGTGPAALTLLDALGRTVRTQPAPTGTDVPFDLAGLAPGVYALRVQSGREATATQKLVVE